MASFQQTQFAPTRSGGIDTAAWALIALIVALACGAAGWAIASQAGTSMDDVAQNSELAARDGLMRGEAAGISEGSRLGRREAAARTRARMLSERRAAAREGYDAGYMSGRQKAGDPDAYLAGTAGASAGGAYPAAGYEDILAADLFGSDVPGYSDSAYDSVGFGAGAGQPYLGAGNGTGDSYGY